MERITHVLAWMSAAVAVLLVVALASPPALAATEADVWKVVDKASANNQNVLNVFTGAALAATTLDELDDAYSKSYDDLEYAYFTAESALEAIEAETPELAPLVDTALSQVKADHEASHDEMDATYRTVKERLKDTAPTTTTTTKPTVTTTTRPTTTTTTTTRPTTTTTTTSPEADVTTTTTRPTTTTTSPPDAGGIIPPWDPGDGMSDHIRSVGSGQLWVAPPTSGTPSAVAAKAEATSMPAMSSMLTDAASVILPPAVVSIAVAPVIVVEVLFRTIFDSARSLFLPALMLMVTMAWLVWRERRQSAGAGT